MESHPKHQPPVETVLTFLESIGLRSEAEFYVRLFRQQPKEGFAIILPTESVAEHNLSALQEQLRYLAYLGLHAPLVLGGIDPCDTLAPARELSDGLRKLDLGGHIFDADQVGLVGALRAQLRAEKIPIVVFAARVTLPERVARVGALTAALGSRKLVLLRQRGGIGPHVEEGLVLGKGHVLRARSGGISVINLKTDHPALTGTGALSKEDDATLAWIAEFCKETSGRVPVNVASPLNLLRELFTVKGAGTLVRSGSEVLRYTTYAELDVPRLRALIESSFGRQLRAEFFEIQPLAIYVEADYRAAAVLHPGAPAPLLSKFAVDRLAQGEGLGQELWQHMLWHHTSLVWRARLDNPITSWYLTVCDGMQRTPDWQVYWRGLPIEEAPAAVALAVRAERDFLT